MSEKELVKPIPESRSEAVLRDLITSLPVVGDALLLAESIEAFKQGKVIPSILYLINILPIPTLPATHVIVYELEKQEIEKELKIK
jgi:hypothetical protein